MLQDTLTMFFYYTKMTVKAWFQYKVDAILRSLAVFLREATGIIVIYLTLQTFGEINGWKVSEMFFLYSLLFITYGILIVFFTGLRDLGYIIQNGQFDRIMLRPRGLLFQIISFNSDWFAAIGHGGLGIFLFVISANKVGISWSLSTVVFYFFTMIGGVLIQGAVFLLFASLNFLLIKTDNLKELLYWNMRKFAGYPISIFHKAIQFILIYVMPFAFVNYFPSQFLLRKEDMAAYPSIYLYLTPVIGISLYSLSYFFWRYSVKFYRSTGN